MSDLHAYHNAYLGSLAADALAMPVHWYYDRSALRAAYGVVTRFVAPQPKHTGSILWRSKYEPLNERADILRDQSKYWGQKEVHYHQFLQAGENTLNFKLAIELHGLVKLKGTYDSETWLERYVACMLQPGWHRDTYAEEYHRAFFNNYAKGKAPKVCGIEDEHIGGLATVPALIAGLVGTPLPELRKAVQIHVALTHKHEGVLRAADTLTLLLAEVAAGVSLRDAMRKHSSDWLSPTKAEAWQKTEPDEQVIGQRFSPACYIAESMPAALYLAWKYHDRFAEGLTANAMVGGDNCHRGAVVGALLGAACAHTEAEIANLH
jgi:ADP-ribosyl-[dinitrogen reductase] hydrolase